MHPLDNVIWQALTTRQAQFAETVGQARRFIPEVTALTAFSEPSAESYQSLAKLVGWGGTAALFLDAPYEQTPPELKAGWELRAGFPLLEMVCENGAGSVKPRNGSSAIAKFSIVELGPHDSPEMLELTALTKPGPFGRRTHELGNSVGIRSKGKLVAMSGQRLKVPGYAEVSAVCTHPDHTGKGYAGVLMSEVMRRIRERGEIPMLHVREDNLRAIELYERLGFRTRVQLHLAVLRKA